MWEPVVTVFPSIAAKSASSKTSRRKKPSPNSSPSSRQIKTVNKFKHNEKRKKNVRRNNVRCKIYVRRNNVRCKIYVRRKKKRTLEGAHFLELTIVRLVHRTSVLHTSFVHRTSVHRTLVHRLLAVVLGVIRLFLQFPEEGTHGLFAVRGVFLSCESGLVGTDLHQVFRTSAYCRCD